MLCVKTAKNNIAVQNIYNTKVKRTKVGKTISTSETNTR